MPTTMYCLSAACWMTVFDAASPADALRKAREHARASGGPLRPSEIHPAHLRPATTDDLAWFAGQSA